MGKIQIFFFQRETEINGGKQQEHGHYEMNKIQFSK